MALIPRHYTIAGTLLLLSGARTSDVRRSSGTQSWGAAERWEMHLAAPTVPPAMRGQLPSCAASHNDGGQHRSDTGGRTRSARSRCSDAEGACDQLRPREHTAIGGPCRCVPTTAVDGAAFMRPLARVFGPEQITPKRKRQTQTPFAFISSICIPGSKARQAKLPPRRSPKRSPGPTLTRWHSHRADLCSWLLGVEAKR